MQMHRSALVVSMVAVLSATTAQAAPTFVFRDLGRLGTDVSGFGYSEGIAINAPGQVAGISTTYDSSGSPTGVSAFL